MQEVAAGRAQGKTTGRLGVRARRRQGGARGADPSGGGSGGRDRAVPGPRAEHRGRAETRVDPRR